MKIALFSAFYPYRGGIAQFSAQLYRALEKDNEVKAYTFSRQYPNFLFPGSSQFVTTDDNADVIESERILDTVNPFSFGASAKRINAYEPELFISQYWMTFFGPSIGRMTKKVSPTCKKISILHNVIPHEKRFFDKPANNYFLKQNDGYVVLSDAVLKDLLSLKPDAKYIRIDHPVYNQFGERLRKDEAANTLNLNPEKKYLLFFGFIRDYKGLDLLLTTMKDLPDDTHLIVAGEVYGDFEVYQNIIDSNGINDRVHLFTRYITDDEVKLFFSVSDVCILPYKSATQSGITAIANHFELPVIATDVGGLKENIKDGVNGLIVERPDTELLLESITKYFDQNLRDEFAKEIKINNDHNSWENFASRIIEFAKTL